MKKLYSAAQSKQIDETSQSEFCIPEASLMEDAAFCLYQEIKDKIRPGHRTVFLAGGGNNGGDALAIARLAYLDGRRDIFVLLCDSGNETPLRKAQRTACCRIGVPFTREIGDATLVIDGLLGIGLKGEVREPYLSLIREINGRGLEVIGIDVPSGVGDNATFKEAIKCSMTISLGVRKYSMYLPQNRGAAGTIKDGFPFFPEKAIPEAGLALLGSEDIKAKKMDGDSYKKTRGSIAIAGGSGRFTGAVVLSANAAFHTGVGLVTIITEKDLVPSIAKAIPSAMVTTYESCPDLSTFDAVLVGPGMGNGHDPMLEKALKEAKRLVVDADGVRAFSRLGADGQGKCILTPHLGEYQDLKDAFAPECIIDTPETWIETLETVQRRTNATLVVKASTVWVRKSGKTLVIDGNNPSLGVAGSGDVLAGIITALYAQNNEESAEQGALIHQEAGHTAKCSMGFYSSSDLVNFIGNTVSKTLGSNPDG